MTLGEWVFLVVLCAIFVVLVMPVLRSRSLLFTRDQSGETHPDGAKNNDEIAREVFEGNLDFAKKDMCIVSGALYPRVYSEQLAHVVRERLEKDPKLEIRILVGPDILTKEGRNSFWELCESHDFGERFQIRLLGSYPAEHFRVMDSTGLFREEGHHMVAFKRNYHQTYSSFVNAPIYAKHFNDAWSKVNTNRKPTFVEAPPEVESEALST